MRKEKNLALKLRKNGLSYKQIGDRLNLPKSTLSYWLKDLKISARAKNKISKRAHEKSVAALIKRNIQQTALAKNRADIIIKNAKKEFRFLVNNKLFLTGISLYWAEGYKKGAYGSKWKCVDFANSDPDMIRIMLKFFRLVCGAKDEKIKIQLMAHKNIKIEKAKKFWLELSGLPQSQFINTFIRNKKGRKNNLLDYGTVHIRISDVKLFFRIIGWINGLNIYINKRAVVYR